MTAVDLTERQRADLEVARGMASYGIPIFLGTPDPTKALGFALPGRWQQTVPDPSVVDRWQPGMALCAAMGCGLDALDFDPRNGGDPAALDGIMPVVYGVAATPSDGTHHLIASLGVGSLDGTWPGIDVKGGLADGNGRGFVFLAPTVKASKVNGELVAYRWLQVPDLARLAAGGDGSGAAVAAQVRARRSDGGKKRVTGGSALYQEFINSHEAHSWTMAERAIAAELAAVANCPRDGGFRRVLMRAAYTLGGYVGGHYLDEEVARKRLDEAITEAWGSPPDDNDLKWIQQGLDDGGCVPFHVYTAEDERRYSDVAQAIAAQGEAPPAEGVPGPPWSVFAALGSEPFDPSQDGTDQGLAKAVAARMYPALRFATDAGTWIKRERDVWVEHADDMSEWAIAILAELMPLGDTPVPKDLGDRTEQHWQAVRRAGFMSSVGTGKVARKLRAILRSDHPASLEVTWLDANPEVLWAGGVAWDLRESGDAPVPAYWVDPGTPHLRTALCAPEAGCPTPRWDAFVAAVLPDPEVRAWALRVLSIALTGYPDAALPVLYGPERSGKTSLVQMLVTLLGSYGHAASPKLLNAQDSSHETILYDLKGRRLSFIDEGPKRGHDATERLKQITGGGCFTCRAMRANSVTINPTHTLVMTTNNEPHLTDSALRARMRLIPCDAAESDVRPPRLALLGKGLIDEAPGILASLMRETAAYLADRDSASTASAPVSVRGLALDLAQAQDPAREWVEDCTVSADPGTPGRALYTSFCRWHQDHPLYRKTVIPTETSFGRSLSGMGYPPKKTRGLAYRPLSVLAGPSGIAPWEPMPDPHMTRTTGHSEMSEVSRVGPGCVEGQVAPEPTIDENSSSGPVSSSCLDGLDSHNNNKQTKKQNTHIKDIQKKREPETTLPPPALPPTATDVALRASSAKITKAEARLQLKAEQRLASIAEASGETFTLPAVVDRDGHILPLTLAQVERVVGSAVQRSGALTVDVETTGYPVGHADYALRSVQLGDAVAAVVLHPVEHAGTIRDLLAAAPALHAHSATADLVPLVHAGLADAEPAWERMHDTVIPAKLADPASTGSDPGLKKLAPAVLGTGSVAPAADAGRDALFKAGKWLKDTVETTPVERSGWAQVDTRCSTMLRYAASDVLDTAALAQALTWPDRAIYDRERLAQRMTARVALHGIRLDAAHIAELTELHTAGRADAATTVRGFGVENPGSDQQVGLAAVALGATLPQTPSGRPSVAAGILEPLRGSEGPLGELVGAVLDYRHADTALGLFLEPFRLLCERGDGRVRTTIYTLGTDTGRMSSVRKNLQQLSRQGGMRACLIADPGYLMIGADLKGVEICVAAALSQDPALMQMLIDGRDLHAEIARLVWGPDATKAHRYKAKPMVFQRIYGGGVPGMARQHGVSLATAQAVVDALDRLTPTLSAWSRALSNAAQHGQTTFQSYSGRVIHLPRDRAYAAPNYAIQGSARELLVDALVRWNETRWGGYVLLPVHDELDVFVPEAEAEAQEATAELVRCMETTLYGVRITAEPAVPAFAWADAT